MTSQATSRHETFRSTSTSRAAVVITQGQSYEVVFGQVLEGGEFAVSYSTPSRSFKSAAGAMRAVTRWIA